MPHHHVGLAQHGAAAEAYLSAARDGVAQLPPDSAYLHGMPEHALDIERRIRLRCLLAQTEAQVALAHGLAALIETIRARA